MTYPPPAEHSPAFPVVDMTASAGAVQCTVTAYDSVNAHPTHPIYSSSQHSIMTTGENAKIGLLCASAEYLSAYFIPYRIKIYTKNSNQSQIDQIYWIEDKLSLTLNFFDILSYH